MSGVLQGRHEWGPHRPRNRVVPVDQTLVAQRNWECPRVELVLEVQLRPPIRLLRYRALVPFPELDEPQTPPRGNVANSHTQDSYISNCYRRFRILRFGSSIYIPLLTKSPPLFPLTPLSLTLCPECGLFHLIQLFGCLQFLSISCSRKTR